MLIAIDCLCLLNVYLSANSTHLFFFLFPLIRRPPKSTLFPTRRSSDLYSRDDSREHNGRAHSRQRRKQAVPRAYNKRGKRSVFLDRKSTRLNSSHVSISYAVFCLKKKINIRTL